jgi:hypothetical protein
MVGFTVDAATFPDTAGLTLEVYVRVPPGTLRDLDRDDKGNARLRLTMRLNNRYGGKSAQRQRGVPGPGHLSGR